MTRLIETLKAWRYLLILYGIVMCLSVIAYMAIALNTNLYTPVLVIIMPLATVIMGWFYRRDFFPDFFYSPNFSIEVRSSSQRMSLMDMCANMEIRRVGINFYFTHSEDFIWAKMKL